MVAQFQHKIGSQQMAPTMKLPSDTTIRRDIDDGTITYLRAQNLSKHLEDTTSFRSLQSTGGPEQITSAFINAYKDLFGLQNPMDELVLKSVNTDELGFKQVRFRQFFSGIPVWNAEILIQLDSGNHVSLVQGHYIKTPLHLTVRPTLTRSKALEIVAHTLGTEAECRNCKLEIFIYTVEGQKPRLVFAVTITISLIEGWLVIVDANAGSVLNKIPAAYSGSAGETAQ